MGLQDDINRLNSAGDADEAVELQRLEATYRTAAKVWADFLSYCKEFAELAPRSGLQPVTGQTVVGRYRMEDRGNWDDVIDNPGGWSFNVVGYLFCITVDGTLLVETKKAQKRTGLFPMRTRYVHRFEPCPAFPASPSALLGRPHPDEAVMPGFFSLARGGRYSDPPEVVQQDIARFGGALAVGTSECDDSGMKLVFAKSLVLGRLRSAR